MVPAPGGPRISRRGQGRSHGDLVDLDSQSLEQLLEGELGLLSAGGSWARRDPVTSTRGHGRSTSGGGHDDVVAIGFLALPIVLNAKRD